MRPGAGAVIPDIIVITNHENRDPSGVMDIRSRDTLDSDDRQDPRSLSFPNMSPPFSGHRKGEAWEGDHIDSVSFTGYYSIKKTFFMSRQPIDDGVFGGGGSDR